jgi:hypothetical protein
MAIFPTATGTHGAYRWLVTAQLELNALIQRCPEAVVSKYVAVTSLDSGAMVLTDQEKLDGWQSRNEIVYSPQIKSAHDVQTERLPDGFASYNEWYVFNSRFDLGHLWHGNVFEAPPKPGQVSTFVNFGHNFALHDPELATLAKLFWKQLDWIQPESYVADSDSHLTFVTRHEDLFVAARNVVSGIAPNA